MMIVNELKDTILDKEFIDVFYIIGNDGFHCVIESKYVDDAVDAFKNFGDNSYRLFVRNNDGKETDITNILNLK